MWYNDMVRRAARRAVQHCGTLQCPRGYPRPSPRSICSIASLHIFCTCVKEIYGTYHNSQVNSTPIAVPLVPCLCAAATVQAVRYALPPRKANFPAATALSSSTSKPASGPATPPDAVLGPSPAAGSKPPGAPYTHQLLTKKAPTAAPPSPRYTHQLLTLHPTAAARLSDQHSPKNSAPAPATVSGASSQVHTVEEAATARSSKQHEPTGTTPVPATAVSADTPAHTKAQAPTTTIRATTPEQTPSHSPSTPQTASVMSTIGPAKRSSAEDSCAEQSNLLTTPSSADSTGSVVQAEVMGGTQAKQPMIIGAVMAQEAASPTTSESTDDTAENAATPQDETPGASQPTSPSTEPSAPTVGPVSARSAVSKEAPSPKRTARKPAGGKSPPSNKQQQQQQQRLHREMIKRTAANPVSLASIVQEPFPPDLMNFLMKVGPNAIKVAQIAVYGGVPPGGCTLAQMMAAQQSVAGAARYQAQAIACSADGPGSKPGENSAGAAGHQEQAKARPAAGPVGKPGGNSGGKEQRCAAGLAKDAAGKQQEGQKATSSVNNQRQLGRKAQAATAGKGHKRGASGGEVRPTVVTNSPVAQIPAPTAQQVEAMNQWRGGVGGGAGLLPGHVPLPPGNQAPLWMGNPGQQPFMYSPSGVLPWMPFFPPQNVFPCAAMPAAPTSQAVPLPRNYPPQVQKVRMIFLFRVFCHLLACTLLCHVLKFCLFLFLFHVLREPRDA